MDGKDLLGEHIDSVEDKDTEEDDEEIFDSDDEREGFRSEWMHLAEMDSNANIEYSVDLGMRDMDQNHD